MDQDKITILMEQILTEGFGLDTTDPNLIDTASRVSKMYAKEFFSGLTEPPPKVTIFPNRKKFTGIILLDNISFVSMCSHHLLPFRGLAHFSYIPKEHLIGASKVARLISYFSARPQIQEELTQQIVDYFVDVIQPLGVMLVMRASHGCISCRGVRQEGELVTSVVYGSFADNINTRMEGFELIKMSRG